MVDGRSEQMNVETTALDTSGSSSRTNRKVPLWPSVVSGLRLLSAKERRQALGLTAAMGVVNVLDLLSLAAILPFISIVIDPTALRTNRWLASLYGWLGAPPLASCVTWLGGGIVLLILVSGVSKWLLNACLQWYTTVCQSRLARTLLSECLAAPYAWCLAQNHTSLARLIDDDAVIWSRGLVQRIMRMVNDAITTAMVVVLALAVSPLAGLGAIAAVSLIASLGFYATRPLLVRLGRTKRQGLEQARLAVTQALAGVKDVKLSSRETYFTDLFSEGYLTAAKAHASSNIWQETPMVIMLNLGQVALVGLALIFWKFGLNSGQIAAQVTFLILLTTKVIPSASSLAASFSALWNTFPFTEGIHRLRESLVEEIEHAASANAQGTQHLVGWERMTTERLGYCYAGSPRWVLREVTLSLERGVYYGIVGRSGAGKSTLVDLLVGLLQPTEGQVAIDGASLQSLDVKNWQQRISYVPQTLFIIDDSLRANVAFGVPRADVDDTWVWECLRLANLEELSRQLKHGLETRLGDRGVRLSGGQRQRIGIARALYKRPEILIFDEATSSLDTISEQEILAALDNLRGRLTLIVIAHRLTTVAPCDCIVVLEEGRLVGQGTYAELKTNHLLFRRLAAGVAEGRVQTPLAEASREA